MPPGSNADVQWKPVKMLYRYPARNGYYGYEIRIGCWVINGKEGDLILAKQEFKVGDSGYVTWGKARGLTAADLYRIFEQAISRLLATQGQILNIHLQNAPRGGIRRTGAALKRIKLL